jgi:two-component system sensor histidine kinase DegS
MGRVGRLPKQLEHVAYRLVQECLNNIARHASATRVMISVNSADELLRLRVEDDGSGFDVEQALAKRDSLGLAGMRERVALFAGELRVRSRPGKGTKISIELPVR